MMQFPHSTYTSMMKSTALVWLYLYICIKLKRLTWLIYSDGGVIRSTNQITGFWQQCQVRWADDYKHSSRYGTFCLWSILTENMDNGISPAKKQKVANGSNVSSRCCAQFNNNSPFSRNMTFPRLILLCSFRHFVVHANRTFIGYCPKLLIFLCNEAKDVWKGSIYCWDKIPRLCADLLAFFFMHCAL